MIKAKHLRLRIVQRLTNCQSMSSVYCHLCQQMLSARLTPLVVLVQVRRSSARKEMALH